MPRRGETGDRPGVDRNLLGYVAGALADDRRHAQAGADFGQRAQRVAPIRGNVVGRPARRLHADQRHDLRLFAAGPHAHDRQPVNDSPGAAQVEPDRVGQHAEHGNQRRDGEPGQLAAVQSPQHEIVQRPDQHDVQGQEAAQLQECGQHRVRGGERRFTRHRPVHEAFRPARLLARRRHQRVPQALRFVPRAQRLALGIDRQEIDQALAVCRAHDQRRAILKRDQRPGRRLDLSHRHDSGFVRQRFLPFKIGGQWGE